MITRSASVRRNRFLDRIVDAVPIFREPRDEDDAWADQVPVSVHEWDRPGDLHECDVILRGGVASGLVYSTALPRLATRYRLRSIGGTSAGAVGATLAAAAEFRRVRGDGFEGYEDFWRVGKLLEGTGRRHRLLPLIKMRGFIKADEHALTPLFSDIFLPHKGPGRWIIKTIFALIVLAKILLLPVGAVAFVIGLLLAAAVRLGDMLVGIDALEGFRERRSLATRRRFAAFVRNHGDPLIWTKRLLALTAVAALFAGLAALALPLDGWVWTTLGWIVLGAILALVAAATVCTIGLAKPGWGLNSGVGVAAWLHKKTQEVAGLSEHDKPLTLGDLLRPVQDRHDRSIDLRFMATNLTTGEPLSIPPDPSLRRYWFEPKEWAAQQLFPEAILKHMAAASKPATERFFELPYTELPVVVMARMSLSIPLLFRSVPIWALKDEAVGKVVTPHQDDLEEHILSDGGIVSNMPVHFFDSWLPTRPTFGLLLTKEVPEREGDGPHKAIAPRWLWGLVGAVFNTARYAQDNAHRALPGFDERMIELPLPSNVGGFNLNPTTNDLREMRRLGDQCLETFVGDGPRPHFSFTEHRIGRLNLLSEQLRTNLQPGARTHGHSSLADALSPEFLALLAARDPEGLLRVEGIHRLLGSVRDWGPFPGNVQTPPVPRSTQTPSLRITPR